MARAVAACALTAALAAACPSPPPPCHAAAALAGAPDSVPIPQGGRAFVSVRQVDGIVVALAGLAPGFDEREDSGRFIISAPYDLAGSVPVRLVATCTDSGHDVAEHPFTLEVRAPVINQFAAETGPAARTLPAMTVVGNDLVVIGGTSSTSTDVADTWTLDLDTAAWSKLASSAPPSPARAATLDDHRAVVLASSGDSFVVDTKGGAIAALAATAGVVARGAFVPAAGSFVSACGVASAQDCAVSVLSLNGASGTWTTQSPTGFSPTGREGVAYGYDVDGNRLVLFGGAGDDGVAQFDTWDLQLANVSSASVTFDHLATKGQDPPGRIDGCGVVDPIGRRFFVMGGRNADGIVADDWVLDLDHDDARWRPVTLDGIPARSGCAAAYDAAHTRILVGFGDDGTSEHGDVYEIDL
jgi:hypothetical protein